MTFKNETSGEYSFYELKYTATPPAPCGTLSLECPVRTQTSTKITLTNPLASDVTLKPSISSKQVTLSPEQVVLRAGSTSEVEVQYRPLLVGPSEGSLKLESAELGVFEWVLKLVGVATNQERTIGFSVPLGSRETQVSKSLAVYLRGASTVVSFCRHLLPYMECPLE